MRWKIFWFWGLKSGCFWVYTHFFPFGLFVNLIEVLGIGVWMDGRGNGVGFDVGVGAGLVMG
jgi:hypothetical protein